MPSKPRLCACQEGHLEITGLLLRAGAQRDLADHEGTTALLLSCCHPELVLEKESRMELSFCVFFGAGLGLGGAACISRKA